MKDYPGVVVYEGIDYLGRKFFIISRGDSNKPLQVGSSCVVIQLNVGSKVDDSSEIHLYSEVPKALISECWAIFRLDTKRTWLARVFYSEMCLFYTLTGRNSEDLKSFINMLRSKNRKKFTLSQWANFNYSILFSNF